MRRTLLEIADELRAIAGIGLHYSQHEGEERPFDRERYQKVLSIAARLAAAADERDAAELEQTFRAADDGYVTPKLDVRLGVFRNGGVLLVREASDGRWALPGGFVDIGDSPAEAAARETFEEAGVEVRVRRLVGIFDKRLRPEAPPGLFHIHKLVFVGELADPDATPTPGHETTGADFFPTDALPELSLGRTLELHVREALRVFEDPAALPYYD